MTKKKPAVKKKPAATKKQGYNFGQIVLPKPTRPIPFSVEQATARMLNLAGLTG